MHFYPFAFTNYCMCVDCQVWVAEVPRLKDPPAPPRTMRQLKGSIRGETPEETLSRIVYGRFGVHLNATNGGSNGSSLNAANNNGGGNKWWWQLLSSSR